MTEDRSTGGLALPGDCPSTGDTPIRTACKLGSLSNLTLPTQRCGAVGFLRVHAEEDVNTDAFNTTNYLVINLALNDRNTLFTTPHILCTFGIHEILPVEYVDAALSYYVETKDWDAQYVAQLRQHHLEK